MSFCPICSKCPTCCHRDQCWGKASELLASLAKVGFKSQSGFIAEGWLQSSFQGKATTQPLSLDCEQICKSPQEQGPLESSRTSRKYLRFHINKVNYQFTSLPFGLTTVPLEFTKVVKEVKLMAQAQGPPVPRRLVVESLVPGNLPTTYPDPLGSLPRVGLGSEHEEIGTDSSTGFQFRRLPVQAGDRSRLVRPLHMRPIQWHLKRHWHVQQQGGRYKIRLSLCPSMETSVLVPSQGNSPTGKTHSRSLECDSGQTVQTQSSDPDRVVPFSAGVQSLVFELGPGSITNFPSLCHRYRIRQPGR